MTIEEWNNLDKPNECVEVAVEGDIVEQIHDLICLCQRTNNANNIIVFAKQKKNGNYNVSHIRDMFLFCILLWYKYGIEYVRVEGSSDRYNFISKMFPPEIAIKDMDCPHRNVYYVNLRLATPTLVEHANRNEDNVLKTDEYYFYYVQRMYNSSTDPKEKKKYWDQMFYMMLRAITAAIKKKLVNVKRDDIDELALDATCQVMNRYLKPEGYEVQYLLACAHWSAIGVLYNGKQKFKDDCISYEEWESYQYAKENNMTK